MNKFLTIVSYPEKEDGEFITTKQDYEIISLRQLDKLGMLYEVSKYTLFLVFGEDHYEYPLSSSVSDDDAYKLIKTCTDFLDSNAPTMLLDLTKYQR